LQARPDAERAQQRDQEKKDVQPGSSLGRTDYDDSDFLPFRIKDLIFLRGKGIIRHGTSPDRYVHLSWQWQFGDNGELGNWVT
jgi:hypothetical protein